MNKFKKICCHSLNQLRSDGNGKTRFVSGKGFRNIKYSSYYTLNYFESIVLFTRCHMLLRIFVFVDLMRKMGPISRAVDEALIISRSFVHPAWLTISNVTLILSS